MRIIFKYLTKDYKIFDFYRRERADKILILNTFVIMMFIVLIMIIIYMIFFSDDLEIKLLIS